MHITEAINSHNCLDDICDKETHIHTSLTLYNTHNEIKNASIVKYCGHTIFHSSLIYSGNFFDKKMRRGRKDRTPVTHKNRIKTYIITRTVKKRDSC